MRCKVQQLYVLVQLHWYRKEHFGKLIGAYEKFQNAVLALQYCQNTVEKFSTSNQNEPHCIKNEQRTFAATYSNEMTGDDGEDLEFTVFVIVNAVGPLIHDTRNCFRTIELDVKFPVWVTNASKLEKDIRNSVIANIHFTE